MSEDARKDCRTQGKYSDRNQYCEDKRPQKRQDKRQKGSPTVKEPQEKKFHKRKSDGGKTSNTSLSSESESPIRYEENSFHNFSQLDDVKKPVEIKTPGKHVLSDTENGQSLVYYEPYLFDEDEAADFMNRLADTTNWYEKNIIIHGVEYPQPRLVAWYGPFPYTYSGATLEPAEMPDCVLAIKEKVEKYLKKQGIDVTLNSVLLNLYRNNKDSVSWHSDDEMSMGVCPTIASVSLGETRKFEMRRKMKQQPIEESTFVKDNEYFVHLSSGSLLIMDGCMQDDWQHRVPKEYHDKYQRINLTFRTVYELGDSSPGTSARKRSTDSVLKKSCWNKTDNGVDYNNEDFPPLNSDTNRVKKSPESSTSVGIKTGWEFNGTHKRRSNGSFSCNKTPSQNSNEITGSENVWNTENFPNNKTSLKTHGKIDQSGEMRNTESSPFNKTSSITDDKVSGSEEPWDSELSPCNDNFLKTDAVINELEMHTTKPSFNKKSTTLNNLNDDKKNVKIDMQNKNLGAYDSDFSKRNVNATTNARRNKHFSPKERHYVPSSSNNNMHEKAHKVKDEPAPSKDHGSVLNVEAKEFVPCFKYSYAAFGLENLLTYNTDLMNCDSLMDYSLALRNRVLEKLHEFSLSYQEELEILCAITDGDQTEKNQKIITSRISALVKKALKDLTSPNFRKPYGNSRKFNHGNQNHFSERKYLSGSRDSHHRH